MKLIKANLYIGFCLFLCWPVAALGQEVAISQDTAIQQQFLQECLALAHKRNLEVIAEIPQYAPEKLPNKVDVLNLPGNSWTNEADLFALKWKVTYEVLSGYLLIGHQYASDELHGSDSYSLNEPSQKKAVDFIEKLNLTQLQSLSQEGRIPLSLLSTTQYDLLIETLRQAGNKNINSLTQETPGYIRLVYWPSIVLYSNGQWIGAIKANATSVDYELYNAEEMKPPTSIVPELVLDTVDNHIAIPNLIRSVTINITPARKLVLDRRLEGLKSSIFVSSKKVPFHVGWRFITQSLDLVMRDLSEIRYVTCAKTLPSEAVEKQNVSFSQRTLQKIAPALEAATFRLQSTRQLWEVAPSVFLSGRPLFRLELSPQLRSRLEKLQPGVRTIISDEPKAAVAAWTLITIALTVQTNTKPMRAGASVVLPPARPIDSWAFDQSLVGAEK